MPIDLLRLSHLSAGYHRSAILSDLNLSATERELIALIGRNGVGKSTLMRTIARLQPAISGDITIAGKPLHQYARNELAHLLGIASTEPVGSLHLTVRQLVSFGRFPYTNWLGKLSVEDSILVEESMQLVGIMPLQDKNLHEISDGERQRAMIARTLAQDTDIILLDEPTAFLDMPNKYEVIRLLHHLTRTKRKTIIFSTHDLNITMQEADKLWLMVDNVLYEGAPEDLVLNGQLVRVFEGTELQFDDSKGEFNIKRTNTQSICLAGSNNAYFWTKKALERLGFSVRQVPEYYPVGIVVSDDLPISWTFRHRGGQIHFNTIYDMSQFLLKNNNLV